MEPNWYMSIGGIATFTVVLVQGLKAWLSGTDNPLSRVPTALYVVIVAMLGTWFAHDILHALEGELPRLLTDAVTAALIASGAFEMARSATKRIGSAGLAVLLAVGLAFGGVACASSQKERVVMAYQATQTALGSFQDAERALYAAKTLPALNDARHRAITQALVRAFDVQDTFGAALLIWRTGEPLPNELNEWFVEIERVLDEIQTLDTGGTLPVELAQHVVEWARAIVDLAGVLQVSPPASVAQVAAR